MRQHHALPRKERGSWISCIAKVLSRGGGAAFVLLAFPLLLLAAFSRFPRRANEDVARDVDLSAHPLLGRSQGSNQNFEKAADLPHVPHHNYAKDLSLSEKAAEAVAGLVAGTPKSVFDFRATNIDGEDVKLSRFEGNVLMIVNVASQCGYTDIHYKELKVLYDRYRDLGFYVLAFPSNEFGTQEPGSSSDIKKFVTEKYKATFPLFSKIKVNGKDTHPLYAFLKAQFGMKAIPWNFQKFLVDRRGQVVSQHPPQIGPLAIEAELLGLLKAPKR